MELKIPYESSEIL